MSQMGLEVAVKRQATTCDPNAGAAGDPEPLQTPENSTEAGGNAAAAVRIPSDVPAASAAAVRLGAEPDTAER